MGLPMNDIHSPTVRAGPVSGDDFHQQMNKESVSLTDLISEKTRVEEELAALSSVLDSVSHYSTKKSV